MHQLLFFEKQLPITCKKHFDLLFILRYKFNYYNIILDINFNINTRRTGVKYYEKNQNKILREGPKAVILTPPA